MAAVPVRYGHAGRVTLPIRSQQVATLPCGGGWERLPLDHREGVRLEAEDRRAVGLNVERHFGVGAHRVRQVAARLFERYAGNLYRDVCRLRDVVVVRVAGDDERARAVLALRRHGAEAADRLADLALEEGARVRGRFLAAPLL